MATIVGESCLIKGNLEGDEDLTVFGRVEGSMRLTRTLIVEPSGIVKADVYVRNAVVNGVVVGNITATDAVELTDQARVVGDLTAPRVIIVDGASFRGQVDMGDLDMKRPITTTRPSLQSRPATSTTPRSTPSAPSRPTASAPSRPASSAPSNAPKAATPAPKAPPAPPARAVVSAPSAQKKKAPSAPPAPPRRGSGKKVRVKKHSRR